MLIELNGTNETKRVQCRWVSEEEEEVQAVTDFLRSQGEPVYDENILEPRDDEAAEETTTARPTRCTTRRRPPPLLAAQVVEQPEPISRS
jgi:DNA segregation ATPase FtsK/SpoIIIE-like protein